jgi:hypothetical protein
LVSHESSFHELQQPHEPLLRAGPAPELAPRVQNAPSGGALPLRQRRAVKRLALLLFAAALSIAVFVSGYVVRNRRGGPAPRNAVVKTLALEGTSVAPHARAKLEVSHGQGANWPMTLRVVGLPKLPPDTYYEVDLVRGGKPWGSCGTFRISSAPRAVTLTLNSPYALRKGDYWVVTRQAPDRERGVTALRPV